MKSIWFALLLGVPGLAQDDAAGRNEVIATVQRLFDAMEKRDTKLAGEVLMEEGQYFSVIGPRAPIRVTHADFIKRLGEGGPKLLERIWTPRVIIHGRMAQLWAPYDFHRDGVFTHCGVDTFHLIRTDSGWRIAGFAYTVEKENCPRNPNGPPATK